MKLHILNAEVNCPKCFELEHGPDTCNTLINIQTYSVCKPHCACCLSVFTSSKPTLEAGHDIPNWLQDTFDKARMHSHLVSGLRECRNSHWRQSKSTISHFIDLLGKVLRGEDLRCFQLIGHVIAEGKIVLHDPDVTSLVS